MARLVIGNQTGVLESDNAKLMKALREKYTFKIPGAEYSRAYKTRRWDGKTSFFTPTGRFGSGMVYHLINDLEYIEEPYEIVDNRTDVDVGDFAIDGVEYRKYQRDSIEECLKYKNGIVLAPTGSGKTIILAGLLKSLEKETGLIFFTKKSLLKQTYDELTKLGFDVGVAFGDGVDIKPITLCTIQSVEKVIDTHLKTSTFIMFDEVQEFSKGKLASKAVKSFPNASYRFGFTATMPKDPISKLNIISYLGPTRDTADAVSLADMGYLTPPCIQIVKMKSDPTIDDLDLSYPEVYDKYITNNKNRNDYIANMVEKIRDKPSKTLIITKNLDHAKALNRLIPGSHLLMGKNSLDERDEKVKEFIKEESSVLIGTVIFQTGINIPEITHLINTQGQNNNTQGQNNNTQGQNDQQQAKPENTNGKKKVEEVKVTPTPAQRMNDPEARANDRGNRAAALIGKLSARMKSREDYPEGSPLHTGGSSEVDRKRMSKLQKIQ